ncbi:hyaluronidase [Halyomorpha halys]|uniref:hyaluronidase n=1 Tax=Halyomorpha halys TaxID=286706 RepID=UPI0006D4DDCA|nr:hyaluronidase-like [Halyomorpha halys]
MIDDKTKTLLFCYYRHIKLKKDFFSIYWNIPTAMCQKYGINFSDLNDHGILQNGNDEFVGEKITILYDPGFFPAMLNRSIRNNGIPQEGDLKKHLILFEKELETAIPEKNFSGIGVIDFEHWRPIWRENWGSLDKYKQLSLDTERKRHPFWSKTALENRAIQRFEKAASRFIDETLSKAVKLRPRGQWGYYAYPYCFNFTPKNPEKKCTQNVQKDNDRSSWMFRTGNALFPSLYLREKQLNEYKRVKMMEGRINEAKRLASKDALKQINIFPYLAIKYQDTYSFLSKQDMLNAIKTARKTGSSGLILWASYKDTNSAKKCQQLQDYVQNTLKPVIKGL